MIGLDNKQTGNLHSCPQTEIKRRKKQSNISDPPVNIIHMTTRTTNTPEMDHWMNDLYIVTYISYKHEIF